MAPENEMLEAFSADQRRQLAEALGLKCTEEIEAAVLAIVQTIIFHHLMIAAKNRTPKRVKAKRKLLQIADAARKLHLLLSDFEISNSIGNEIGKLEIFSPEMAKVFHRRPLWIDDEVSVHDMLGMLKNIDMNATLLATKDKSFSYHYMLPTMHEANRNFDANMLWPRLFKFWEMAGNVVAATPDGPTFRFLGLIHEVAKIQPPELGSLRSACERWRTDPMRELHEEVPWLA